MATCPASLADYSATTLPFIFGFLFSTWMFYEKSHLHSLCVGKASITIITILWMCTLNIIMLIRVVCPSCFTIVYQNE